jgi:hypothetical protein
MNRSALQSLWPLPLAAFVLLAPNGMNRVDATVAALDAPAVAHRIAARIKPYLGTLVAAKCVERDGKTTVVDPAYDCHFGAARSEVFVLPDQNVAEGLTPGEAMNLLQVDIGSASAGRQCASMDDLVAAIDDEAKRPGPAARREVLLAMRMRAVLQQQRLLC